MIFLFTSDPDFNTAPPDGYYANSGWQWQGGYSHGTGTVVSQDQVLTAKHFAGKNAFIIHGKKYAVLKTEDDPHASASLIVFALAGGSVVSGISVNRFRGKRRKQGALTQKNRAKSPVE